LGHGEEILRQLVVAGRDPPEVLQLGEEALDQVPLAIEPCAEVPFWPTVGFGGVLANAPFSRRDARMRSADDGHQRADASRLIGKQWLDHKLFEVSQVVSAHPTLNHVLVQFGSPSVGKRPLANFEVPWEIEPCSTSRQYPWEKRAFRLSDCWSFYHHRLWQRWQTRNPPSLSYGLSRGLSQL